MGQVLLGHASTSYGAFENNVCIQDADTNWHSVFRATDSNIANKLADCMVKACRNDNIGYSQDSRYTLRDQVADKGYDPSKATSRCYCDCSSLVELCCFYAGVPIGYNTTSSEENNLLSTGKFQKVLSGSDARDISRYQRGDILLRDGHTALIVSTNGEAGTGEFATYSNNMRSMSYPFPKYSLTDQQVRQIANLCEHEQGSKAGATAQASLIANQLETWEKCKKYKGNIIDYIKKSGWFSSATKYMLINSADDETVEAVKDVLVNGNRTLPLFVDNHSRYSDISKATNNGENIDKHDRSAYIQDVTIIKNIFGNSYKFWCFPDDTSDAFGYTNESLRKSWEMYLNPISTNVSSSIQIDWTRLKPYLLYVDSNTNRKLDYINLMNNHGVIGVMIEGGSGFQIEGFRNPKCYDQARAAMEAECPFGYVLNSTAKNTKEAALETENMRFLVSHYAPALGVWVSFGMNQNIRTNDAIMDVYQKDFIKFGLKNKIGIRCTRDQLKKITWMNYQEDWWLWLIDPVNDVEEIKQLLDPVFFDTDGLSGPIRGAHGGIFSISGGGGTTSGWGSGTTGPDIDTIAQCVYAIFHEWGIPDANICGLMGCYTGENGMDVTSIEADYKFHPNEKYTWPGTKAQEFEDFTAYTLKAMAYHHTNSSFYQDPTDGKWYAGIGMTSSTGILAHRLLSYAERIGFPWYTVECQAAYMLETWENGGFAQDGWLRNWTSPEADAASATHAYNSHYEMPGKPAPARYVAAGVDWYNRLDFLKQGLSKFGGIAKAVVAFVRGGSQGSLSVGSSSGSGFSGQLSPIQKKIVDTAVNGGIDEIGGFCLGWVNKVYKAAGYDASLLHCSYAIDVWNNATLKNEDWRNAPPGSVVVGSGVMSQWGVVGHVGIAIGDYKGDGNNYVISNCSSGVPKTIETLESHNSWQKGNCQGHVGCIGWVWPHGKDLSRMSSI